MAGSVVNYVKECYDELTHKVSWPTRAELQNSTFVVFVASLVIALIVFVMDITFGAHLSLSWKGILGYFYSMLM